MNRLKKDNKKQNLHKFKFFKFFLAFALVFSFFPAMEVVGENARAYAGELSQRYETIFNDVALEQCSLEDCYRGRLKSDEEIEEQQNNGGIYEMVDRSEAKYNDAYAEEVENSKKSNDGYVRTDALPDSVDLRDRGIVSNVRKQSPWGT